VDTSQYARSVLPGDAYVDWVALDGYNKVGTGMGWQTWNQIFSKSYQDITALTSAAYGRGSFQQRGNLSPGCNGAKQSILDT
jgi:beta-mannanase